MTIATVRFPSYAALNVRACDMRESQNGKDSSMTKLLAIVILAGTATWSAPQLHIGASADVPRDVPACELADQWVAANPNKLPTTLEAFVAHSIAVRRAIYDALDAETRVSLWREHLGIVIHEATSLTQRQFLNGVTRDLPNLLDPEITPPGELEALWEFATAILGVDFARRALLDLGRTEVAPENDRSAPQVLCSCSVERKDCPQGAGDASCLEGACAERRRGCWILDRYKCDGLCWLDDPPVT